MAGVFVKGHDSWVGLSQGSYRKEAIWWERWNGCMHAMCGGKRAETIVKASVPPLRQGYGFGANW